jgi:hypothetical protein
MRRLDCVRAVNRQRSVDNGTVKRTSGPCGARGDTHKRPLKKGWNMRSATAGFGIARSLASSVILMLFFPELRPGPRSTLANPAKRYSFGGGATEIVSPGVV